ncbi:hypothetical protein B0J18DRAFT_424003 [Chaetomium sp. MPI-SDFR-AT-0129]|nr:hypothetical protein B0J18DRAFT_424003 [Chaetomium sp. MPI-SDFR-AT-0129]
MEQPTSQSGSGPDAPSASVRPPAPGRKRSSSGAGGLLSKFPFMRSAGEHRPRSRRNTLESDPAAAASAPSLPTPSFITIPADASQTHTQTQTREDSQARPHVLQNSILQQAAQHKTRRRRGSLRKVALLGRGAQRERREARGGLTIDTSLGDSSNGTPYRIVSSEGVPLASSPGEINGYTQKLSAGNQDPTSPAYGLGISDLTPRPGMENGIPRSEAAPSIRLPGSLKPHTETSPIISYSTTDDEDALHMARSNSNNSNNHMSLPIPRTSAPSLSLSSGSESYLPTRLVPGAHTTSPTVNGSGSSPITTALPPNISRRRNGTIQQHQRATSPLALAAPISQQSPDPADWDYAETEWWGWIILVVTWTVFVIGMGSCLGVWSWAWDVGTTPYAPPELEDDPTLPIVGYYPALMILTGVMAWVWVVVAWVGMKYFRHAQVSAD